jgi:3-keto-disaccharide hydrolase
MSTRALFFCVVAACCMAAPVLAEPAPGASGDPFMGEYEGVYHWVGRPDVPSKGMIIAEGPGLYRMVAQCQVEGGQINQVELHGQLVGPRVTFHGYTGSGEWNAEAKDGSLSVTGSYHTSFELKKMEKHSPTEGQAPPEGAVVLLPYESGKAPDMSAWANSNWKAYDDGSMGVQPGSGPNTTKGKIGDCNLHLEFYLPLMAGDFGQGRSNSGVYVQNRYEVQLLDSFGVLPQTSGDCGGLYDVSTALVNASFPPERWQTYDIEFRAARLNADGTQKEPARITVRHNGVVIQENIALAEPTPGGTPGPGAAEDILHLQDHGNRVRFRNIWYMPLKD